MPLCNSQIGGPRITQTMGVGCKTSKTENKAWVSGTNDVMCQRHFTDSDHRQIKSFGEKVVNFYGFIRLFVMSSDKSLVDFNEIKQIVRPT